MLLHVDFTAADMCLPNLCVPMRVARTAEIPTVLLCAFSSAGICLPSSCLAINYSGFYASCHKYRLYNVGDRPESCGNPGHISVGIDISPLTETLNFLWERKELTSFTSIRLIGSFNSNNLCSKLMCRVVSKAFSVSKNTGAVDTILLKFKVMWSISLIQWSSIFSLL
jgi:hypothetical protein